MSEPLSNDKLVDVWMRHNELRWKVVTSSPIFSATILVGWHSLETANAPTIQNLILVLGIAAMFAYYVLIRRLSDYAGAYYDAIPKKPAIPAAVLGLPANKLGNAISIILGILFLLLLFVDLPTNEVPFTAAIGD